MNHYDILIAGAGALALSTAFAAWRRDGRLRIAIVAPNALPGGASMAAGAMLGGFGEITETTLATEAGRLRFDIARRSAGIWSEWLDAVDSVAGGNPSARPAYGAYIITNAKSGTLDDRNFDAIVQALNAHAEPFDTVPPAEVPGLAPLMDARPTRAIHVLGEGHVDSQAWLDHLRNALQATGRVTFLDGEVETVLVQGGRAVGVRLADGSDVAAGAVVLAAGAFSQRIVERIPELRGRTIPVFSGVGAAVVVGQPAAPLPAMVRTPNRAFSCGLHALPLHGGRLYLGATNHVKEDPDRWAIAGDAHFLLDCAITQINEAIEACPVLDLRIGNRPVPLDGFPLIGATSVEGFWIATGTYREGFHGAPLLGSHMASLLMGGPHLISDAFLPERAPINAMTVDDAVRIGVEHFLAAYFESDSRLPRLGWQQFLTETLEERVRAFYRSRTSGFVLPPDFLVEALDPTNGFRQRLEAAVAAYDERAALHH